MASTLDFIEFVCEQIAFTGAVRYRKMFGEYMVYLNDKPIFLICDNTVFVKKLEVVELLLADADVGSPYTGAKEHYVLDIEDRTLAEKVALALETVVPIPKPRKKK